MKARTTPFTPEELAEVRETNIEDRLRTVERTLSLFSILSRAVSTADDLGLSTRHEQPGWSLLSDMGIEALAALEAAQAALPTSVAFLKAPGTRGA